MMMPFGIPSTSFLLLYKIILPWNQIRYCYLPLTKITSKFNPRVSVVRLDVVKIKLYSHFSFDSIQLQTIWAYLLQTQFSVLNRTITTIVFSFCFYINKSISDFRLKPNIHINTTSHVSYNKVPPWAHLPF